MPGRVFTDRQRLPDTRPGHLPQPGTPRQTGSQTVQPHPHLLRLAQTLFRVVTAELAEQNTGIVLQIPYDLAQQVFELARPGVRRGF
ncbi:hypothetical protein GTY88_13955 [Streptomyces sp. SID5926]|nr:hypothetical protein [Streptomyces sp. SID5926]